MTDCVFFDHGHQYCGLFEYEYLHGERTCPCPLYLTERMKDRWLGRRSTITVQQTLFN